MTGIELLQPDWPAPPQVRAASTTRAGGHSQGNWSGFNLATHVGDDPADVAANRRLLAATLGLPREPHWLNQVHGIRVCRLPAGAAGCDADAASSATAGEVCVVLTADCLPVLFTDLDGSRVAAAHAGWRGLAAGVLEAGAAQFDDPARVLAWLGPAIGPRAFEVGGEVRRAFLDRDPASASAFVANRPGHWLADIYALARRRLRAGGVTRIYGGGLCTYSEPDRFYSFRRDRITGRMASLIWLEPQPG
jgi:YfiH family protein